MVKMAVGDQEVLDPFGFNRAIGNVPEEPLRVPAATCIHKGGFLTEMDEIDRSILRTR
jgi:hypothetical protein